MDYAIQQFLPTITANPDDDTPRLVCADYLEENGQEERAEFIRTQIELARISAAVKSEKDSIDTYNSSNHRLIQRQNELFSHEWFIKGKTFSIIQGGMVFGTNCQVRGVDGELHIRRGFVEKIVTTCEKWFRHANAVCAENPVTILGLLDRPDIEFGRVDTETHRDSGLRLTTIRKSWTARVAGRRGPERFLLEASISDLERDTSRYSGYAIEQMDREIDRARTIDGYFSSKWPQIKSLSYPAGGSERIHMANRLGLEISENEVRRALGFPIPEDLSA